MHIPLSYFIIFLFIIAQASKAKVLPLNQIDNNEEFTATPLSNRLCNISDNDIFAVDRGQTKGEEWKKNSI